jgi:molybdopterin molybdotransferase
MAAAMGFAEVAVFRRLRAAVFSTGDEVREPGTALEAGTIYDTNRYALMGMLERLGCIVSDLGIFADRAEPIREALRRAAAAHDVIVTSGGVSKGEEDHVRSAVSALGGVHFWNLAIKPGRPIALGHIDTGQGQTPFIGLPGNPVAVMVTFMLIARPILLRLAGAEAVPPHAFKVAAGFDFKKRPGRREWLRAALVRGDGGWVADKFPEEGSGILTSMVAADGLVELAEDNAGVKRGDAVDFLPFGEMLG